MTPLSIPPLENDIVEGATVGITVTVGNGVIVPKYVGVSVEVLTFLFIGSDP